MVSTYTFPPGTILSPQGTAIIGTGLFGSSVESPSDFYYHGALPTFPHFGGTISSGRILKNAEGVVVDALGYSTVLQQPYTFPNSAELPYYHWNPFGNNFIHNGKMLLGPDKNSHENWAPLSWAPFRPTPNIPNSNVPQPDSALSFPVTWTVNGAFAGSGDVFHAGPFPTPGTYEVIATYPSTNGCGLLSDTAIIIVDFPYCYALDSFQVQTGCEEISLAWTSDNTQKRSFIEYGLAGFTRGSGTLIPGAQSPHTISNLSGNTFYDIYVIDSCFQFDPSINDTVFFDQTIVFDTSIFVTPNPVAGSIHYAHDGMGGYNFWLVGSAGPIEWYFGDGTFANGDSVSHKFMQNGVYNIVVIAENNCGSDTVKLDFKHIGTEVFQAQYLVLYPNPGNGNFRIENAPFKESFQIQMIDGTGNSWILGNFEPKSDFELSITSLPAGIYQMIFTNREGFVIRRVVKL
ncbi:MAG: T9SS type A sorting domain-containing protein [Cryomorphaceae bacterium]|nr:T9SS type A sorting domain-containing protein [Cryomorphaceae bacterium]